ncbi:MAG: amylo-alpha-1,6-glucosidase [Chloroflexota bacterium]
MTETLTIKEGDIFLVSDRLGDIPADGGLAVGLFHQDTRYLSLYELYINGQRPVVLTSSAEHNFMANLQFATPRLDLPDGRVVLPGTISVWRNRFVDGALYERVGFHNYNLFPVTVRIRLRLAADFRDMFEVRGFVRPEHLQGWPPVVHLPPGVAGRRITLAAVGRDGLERRTYVAFLDGDFEPEITTSQALLPVAVAPAATVPDATAPATAVPEPVWVVEVSFDLELPPRRPVFFTIQVAPETPGPGEEEPFEVRVQRLQRDYEAWLGGTTEVWSDHEVWNRLIRRSLLDLRLLTEETPFGPIVHAGIPWFACPFGRDLVITAWQTLMFKPELAVGALRLLANYQGRKVDDFTDEEPGRIMHELRRGELASLGIIPHRPYYGSVDATPLFVVLLAETVRWTGDTGLARELFENATRAMEWVENYGDKDGDGYVEYLTRSPLGIKHQGWKDSETPVLDEWGRPVEPPVALAEVQGYVYAAYLAYADLLEWLGRSGAAEFRRRAAELAERFNRDFWVDGEGFFAIALDAGKRPVRTLASNPGHCLWAGIVAPDRAGRFVDRLLREDMLSGWGLRTLSGQAPGFNPMSYHNGSIWPHDNSLIVAGLKRYGFSEQANLVISQIFDAAQTFRYLRLPELFCGFARDRRYYSAPAEYPLSSSPQAWAAGAALSFCQTLLGVRPDGIRNRLDLNPTLPPWLNEVMVRRLRVGGAELDLRFRRVDGRTTTEILGIRGTIDIRWPAAEFS